ncbi:MAG: PHP domain-containing protein, partial [Anaerolineae bacterium]
MRADLHVHSDASDGKLGAAAVVGYAADKGVSVLALTDHDSLAGVEAASAAAAVCGITFIPGLELTSGIAGQEAHLLGYFIDPRDAG